MTLTPSIREGVRRLFRLGIRRRDRTRADLDEELRFHLDARATQLIALGMSRDAAHAEAVRRLGATFDDTRDRLLRSAERKEDRMAMHERIDEVVQDVAYAFRQLRHRPGFTAVAVLTLAVGIGANTAIFSAVDAILLRALPFAAPQQLAAVSIDNSVAGTSPWSWPKFQVFARAQHAYQAIALHATAPATFSGANPERGSAEWVSAHYLGVLGVRPMLGHDFPADEDSGGNAPRLALISAGTWQRRFDAAPDVVGKFVAVDGDEYEIIGVLPGTFRGLSGKADVWLPITSRSANDLNQPWSLEFDGIARLKPGVTMAQAAAEARLIGPQVYAAYPFTKDMLTTATNERWSAMAQPLDQLRVSPVIRRSLLILFGAVGLVLLIACVNLASLLLARASTRRQEIAVRLAIGAGRFRLVRMLLAESLVLAVAGGGASVLIAGWGAHALHGIRPDAANFGAAIGTNGFDAIRLDPRALGFTLAITLMVGMLFGLVPAWQATRPDVTDDLKSGGSGSGQRLSIGALRRGLVITEIALSLVLLASAGLMLRSLDQLLRVDPGFDGADLLTLRISDQGGPASAPRYGPSHDSVDGRATGPQRAMDALVAIPGVTQVGLADCPPLNGGCNGTIMTFPDRPQSVTGNAMIGVHWVSPDWFSVMRVPLRRGRNFTADDRRDAPRVVLINQAAARAYFHDQNPIGQRVKVYQGGFDAGATVIGMVGDVRFNTIDSTALPDVYIPLAQSPRSNLVVFLRTTGDPDRVAPMVRRVLHAALPLDPVYDMQTMASRIGTASAQPRLTATLLALFALMALGLAVMGIYGVISFGVAQRTREIGIRMALGADRARVLGMVLREGLGLIAAGTVLGLAGALLFTRLLRTLLFQVQPGDPATYAAIVACLAAATLLATWVPARRAAVLEPTEALTRR